MTPTNPALAAFVERVRVHRSAALSSDEMLDAIDDAKFQAPDDYVLGHVASLIRDLSDALPALEAEAKGTNQ